MRHRTGIGYIILCVLFLGCLPAFAWGGNVVAIEVQGNNATTSESILGTIKTKKGETYSRENVQEDIKALWKLGVFQDIQVDKADVAGGGVALTYIVTEKPVITKISFTGNKKLKKEDLEKELTVSTYSPLNEKSLAETINKIKEAYAKKGYYLADVGYDTTPLEGNDAELVFNITEHSGAVVRKIEFVGNHAYKDKALKGIIRTKEKTAFSFLGGGGKLKDEQLEQDVLMLTFHYLNNGYLKVKVDNPRLSISKDKRLIFITYALEEGKQYKISDVDITGDILTTKEELKKLLSTEPKTIFSQKTVEEDMAKLVDFYGEVGYAFVNVRPETDPDDETLTTPVVFNIEKGNRIRIEKINIFGNTTTRDKVIRRELRVKEEDIYNTRLIEESKVRLQQLGYFEEVNFATPRGSKDDTLILNITVKEKPTGTFNIGAGFSTVENFIFSASVAKENFFGYGIGGQLSAELSGKRQQFMLDLRDNYFLDSEWMLNMSGYRSVYRYTDFDRKANGGSVGVGHRIFDHSSVSIGYQLEEVKVADFSSIVPQFFKENASGLTSEMTLVLARDTRNNRIMPTKGAFYSVEQEVSGSKLGGDNDFYRVSGNARLYFPLPWRVVAKANAKIGYIKGLGARAVPLYERYYTGGVYSLRGFQPMSIGPKMMMPSSSAGPDQEFVYGGNKLLLFNGELEFPIYDPAGLKWVFFMDAGNAFAETQQYSFWNLRSDWGLGLRWMSPMGPLRFEWGIPFNRQQGEDPVVFNFTIGSLF